MLSGLMSEVLNFGTDKSHQGYLHGTLAYPCEVLKLARTLDVNISVQAR